jgi:hypothetical protein
MTEEEWNEMGIFKRDGCFFPPIPDSIPDKKPIPDKNVQHPSYYGGADNTYEAIKVIEAWELDFCLGNVVKYICRAGKKGEWKHREDLEKAAWYLSRAIQNLEK